MPVIHFLPFLHIHTLIFSYSHSSLALLLRAGRSAHSYIHILTYIPYIPYIHIHIPLIDSPLSNTHTTWTPLHPMYAFLLVAAWGGLARCDEMGFFLNGWVCMTEGLGIGDRG